MRRLHGKMIDRLVRSKPAALILLFGVLLAGCTKETDNSGPADTAVPVEVTKVAPRTFTEQVRGIGTLQADQVIEVAPERNGIVTGIQFQEGAQVEKDQILVTLDDAKLRSELKSARARLDKARARLEYARKTYNRFQELVEQGAATADRLDQTQTEFETARADVAELEAEVQLIQEDIDDTVIRSPVEGLLGVRHIDIGDYVQEGRNLVSLYVLATLEMAFGVPERYMGKIRTGQDVDVTVTAYPDRSFQGTLSYVDPSVDERTRKFLVKARIDNRQLLLKPGAFASAVIVMEVLENRPSVPESALVATTEGYKVFTVKDGAAVMTSVQVGLREAGVAEIREGLAMGSEIVTAGQMRLSEGNKVRIVKDANSVTEAGAEASMHTNVRPEANSVSETQEGRP